ncbi:MAG: LysR family transcriptional regulator [Rhizobiaceae bacterium]|nr:LysR family transcriptional regulator [Rhizobiaceae bacterium]
MARSRTPLPPLSALQTFESAARHLSFKAAAAELNVTAGAVSHQIRALESALNTPLFNRMHRGVELTTQGEILAQVMHRSLNDITEVIDQLRMADEERSVTIGATTAVSSLWLTPRLSRFWKEHGTIPVNQQVSDTQSAPDNITDFVVRYGTPDLSKPDHHLLFNDRLIPLCNHEFASNYSASSLEEMAALPLIHLDATDENWTTWRTWFDQQGYTAPMAKGIRVNNYTIALQAARDGLGLILGWETLVEPLIRNGELITFGSWSLKAPGCYYIHTKPEGHLSQKAKTVLEWLLHNV